MLSSVLRCFLECLLEVIAAMLEGGEGFCVLKMATSTQELLAFFVSPIFIKLHSHLELFAHYELTLPFLAWLFTFLFAWLGRRGGFVVAATVLALGRIAAFLVAAGRGVLLVALLPEVGLVFGD